MSTPSHGAARLTKAPFSQSGKSTIGISISVSNTHEMNRAEHLSPSTHTHTHTRDDRQYGVTERQTVPPTDIRLTDRTGGWVCHPSCRLHHFLHGSAPSHHRRSQTRTRDRQDKTELSISVKTRTRAGGVVTEL